MQKKQLAAKVRSEFGMSLIEMLTAMMLTGFIAAATCDMMAALGLVSLKADTQVTATLQAKRAFDYIGQSVRSAQHIKSASSYFDAVKKVQSSQTLVLTIPVLGDGTMGSIGGLPILDPSTGKPCIDYVVYEIVADKSKPGSGEYVMQRTYLPGNRGGRAKESPFKNQFAPQIIVKGIVGPQDVTSTPDPIANNYLPKVFSYLTTLNAGVSERANSLASIDVPGVAIQLEIQPAELPNSKIRSTTFGIRSEYFSRVPSDAFQ